MGSDSCSAREQGWEQTGQGAGATGVTKMLDQWINVDEVESVSMDLSLRSRWRITFLQTARRPTGNMILQCLGHFRTSNAESTERLANCYTYS